jgi:threonine dehydrogenase-like Zn-dependent dehydrogenase
MCRSAIPTVFAQGPIGLCATAGAELKGAGFIVGVESDPVRAAIARKMGADVVLDYSKGDVVREIRRMTDGRGVDVAIEALGAQATFENALPVLRADGTLSSLGVYSGKLSVPLEPFAAGLGDHKIVTTLCPGGKERMPLDGTRSSRPIGPPAAFNAHLLSGQDY